MRHFADWCKEENLSRYFSRPVRFRRYRLEFREHQVAGIRVRVTERRE